MVFLFCAGKSWNCEKKFGQKNIEIDDIKNSDGYLEQIIKTVL
jgi:hypothetical protein